MSASDSDSDGQEFFDAETGSSADENEAVERDREGEGEDEDENDMPPLESTSQQGSGGANPETPVKDDPISGKKSESVSESVSANGKLIEEEDEDDDLPPLDSFEQIVQSALSRNIEITWVENGEGWRTPQLKDEIVAHYRVIRSHDSLILESTFGSDPAKFIFGEGDSPIPAANQIIPKMKANSTITASIPAQLVDILKFPKTDLLVEVKLLRFTKVEKLSQDSSLVKRILRHGNQYIKLKKYDEIIYHLSVYDEKMNKLYSSTEVNEPLSGFVGDMTFGMGLNTLLATMMNEEFSQLDCASEYARPCDHSFGKSVYIYQLDLISWVEVSDIKENGRILKRILREGTGSMKGKDGSVVKARIVTKKLDGEVVYSSPSESPIQFTIGHGFVPEAIDNIVESMRIGEVSLSKVEKSQLQDVDLYEIKFAPAQVPDTLVIEIEVFEITPEDFTWLVSLEKKLECGIMIKDTGNRLFKLKRYPEAKKKYESALDVFRYEPDVPLTIKDQLKTNVQIPCDLNLSLIHYKLGDLKESINRATNVISVDSKNVKAYFRRAKAYVDRGDIDQADADFKRAIELDPANKEIAKEYAAFKKIETEHRSSQKKLYSKMFK